MYVRFLFHCYIDTEVDNKEIFTKEHVWELFKSFLVDIAKVCPLSCVCHMTVNWSHSKDMVVMHAGVSAKQR